MLGPFAADEVTEFDARLPEFFACLLGVALTGRGVALLPVLDRAGRVFDQRGGGPAVKPPALHQGAGGAMDLADGYLRIFFSSGVGSYGPGTNN